MSTSIFVHSDLCSWPSLQHNYVLVYVILSVLNVADFLYWRYILSRQEKAVYLYIQPWLLLLHLRKNTDCFMHMQLHPLLQTSGLLCCFDVSNIRSHRIICSLINVSAPKLDIIRLSCCLFNFAVKMAHFNNNAQVCVLNNWSVM